MGNKASPEMSLCRFTKSGNAKELNKLLQTVPVNELNSEGESALRVAYFKGQLGCVQILENNGGLIIPPLSYNQTTLHLAVRLEYH